MHSTTLPKSAPEIKRSEPRPSGVGQLKKKIDNRERVQLRNRKLRRRSVRTEIRKTGIFSPERQQLASRINAAHPDPQFADGPPRVIQHKNTRVARSTQESRDHHFAADTRSDRLSSPISDRSRFSIYPKQQIREASRSPRSARLRARNAQKWTPVSWSRKRSYI